MNTAETLQKLLKHSKTAQRTYQYISAWDEEKTLKENAKNLGLLHTNAQPLAKKYELKYKPRTKEEIDSKRIPQLFAMRDLGLSIKQIARTFEVSRSTIYKIFKKIDAEKLTLPTEQKMETEINKS